MQRKAGKERQIEKREADKERKRQLESELDSLCKSSGLKPSKRHREASSSASVFHPSSSLPVFSQAAAPSSSQAHLQLDAMHDPAHHQQPFGLPLPPPLFTQPEMSHAPEASQPNWPQTSASFSAPGSVPTGHRIDGVGHSLEPGAFLYSTGGTAQWTGLGDRFEGITGTSAIRFQYNEGFDLDFERECYDGGM